MVDVVVVVLLVVLIDRRAWDDCISAGWSFNVNSWGDFGKMVSLWWNQVTMVTMVVEVVKEAKENNVRLLHCEQRRFMATVCRLPSPDPGPVPLHNVTSH